MSDQSRVDKFLQSRLLGKMMSKAHGNSTAVNQTAIAAERKEQYQQGKGVPRYPAPKVAKVGHNALPGLSPDASLQSPSQERLVMPKPSQFAHHNQQTSNANQHYLAAPKQTNVGGAHRVAPYTGSSAVSAREFFEHLSAEAAVVVKCSRQ